MKALTVRQPWAGAIAITDAEGGKRLENRTRPPPRTLPRTELIAIHASLCEDKRVQRECADLAEKMREWDIGSTTGRPAAFGCVVAVCRVVGWIQNDPHGLQDYGWSEGKPERISLGHTLEWIEQQVQRWFTGPYAWILEDVQPLAMPVPARGALGLWTLPEDAERAVMAQVEKMS